MTTMAANATVKSALRTAVSLLPAGSLALHRSTTDRRVRHSRWVPAIAQVEPLTTARALRGPFDYLAPPGAAVGQLLVVPFGRREVTGVVVGLAEESAIAPERLA